MAPAAIDLSMECAKTKTDDRWGVFHNKLKDTSLSLWVVQKWNPKGGKFVIKFFQNEIDHVFHQFSQTALVSFYDWRPMSWGFKDWWIANSWLSAFTKCLHRSCVTWETSGFVPKRRLWKTFQNGTDNKANVSHWQSHFYPCCHSVDGDKATHTFNGYISFSSLNTIHIVPLKLCAQNVRIRRQNRNLIWIRCLSALRQFCSVLIQIEAYSSQKTAAMQWIVQSFKPLINTAELPTSCFHLSFERNESKVTYHELH